MAVQAPSPPAKRVFPGMERTRYPGIYSRGNRYVVVYYDPAGKQRKRFALTLTEARTVKDALNTDVKRGDYRELSRVAFEDYAHDWIKAYAGRTSRGLRESTRADYKRAIERDAIPFFKRMRLSEIEPRHVKLYIAKVASRGVSRDTVRLSLAPVRALFATALEEGLIRSNPATGVRINQQAELAEARQVRALTEKELKALLDKIPADQRLFFTLLAHTGLRVGEAVALRWGDIDFGRRRLDVRRRAYRGTIAPPKSKYGIRTVPLSKPLSQALWALRKSSGNPADESPVFVGERGAAFDRVNLFNKVLKPAARAVGVEWAGFHTFRHTCATMLFRAGLNAKQVQMWLGHHSPAFTLSTYVHLLPDDLPDPTDLPLPALPKMGNTRATRPTEIRREAATAEGA